MYRSADVLNRIVADIDALDNLYLRVLSPSFVALVTSILVVVFLGLFDPLMALTVAMFLAIAGFGVPAIVVRLAGSSGPELAHRISDLRIRIVDALQGLPELLVFGAYPQQIDSGKAKQPGTAKSPAAHESHPGTIAGFGHRCFPVWPSLPRCTWL